MKEGVARAAEAIGQATALVMTAGAGMGVDSGLPDFRGDQGFWKAYPAYAKLGLSFIELANPEWFSSDPELAWGFYGHRLELYRRTRPHAGFAILMGWARRMRDGFFIFTSNVDGQFQRAGFAEENIVEVHGAIDYLQCTDHCGAGIFSAEGQHVDVDESTFRARPPLPRCTRCGALARPNVLMFGDGDWEEERSAEQERRLSEWLSRVQERDDARLVVVECGAGSAIPTVRSFSESLVRRPRALLVRINPREAAVPRGQVSLETGALAGLRSVAG